MSESAIPTNNRGLRIAVFKAFSGKCFYSGRKLDLNNFHIDHVLPRSAGGKDVISNYVACDPCINIQKSDALDLGEIKPILYIVKSVYAPKVERLLKSINKPKKRVIKSATKKKQKEYPKGFVCHAKDELSRKLPKIEITPRNEGYYNRLNGIPMRASHYFFSKKDKADYVSGYREAHEMWQDNYHVSIMLRNGYYMMSSTVKLTPRDKRNLFTFQPKSVSVVSR